ncbi:hypothetical protein [Pseudomonas turukhanskensis]|uniref:Uncharacterized protein n=1 Tax=Pseudomonas turukhanskensis TaxID=1806536 RepID=A0A9W6K7N5_9PSED|nr:hypothetical protein [Pseudomonas turukhanskensis]GLK88969.1 hypothetical protein GCM10017655_20310 [Pseudomonas turukhanskensis]
MNKAKLFALCLLGLVANLPGTFAADGVDRTELGPASTGPTNPTPPTLPTPGAGVDDGTGIDDHQGAPTPGTDGTDQEKTKGNTQAPDGSPPSTDAGGERTSDSPGS